LLLLVKETKWSNNMKRVAAIIFLVVFCLISNQVFAQFLVESSAVNTANLQSSDVLWYYHSPNQSFLLVKNLKFLEQNNINYKFLSDDLETWVYYWVENRQQGGNYFQTLTRLPNTNILWSGDRLALVQTKPDFSRKIAGLPLEIVRINFQKPVRKISLPEPNFVPQNVRGIQGIQTILDSVNIDKIYQTERHLSGEEPFAYSEPEDSIMTRYSRSAEIFTAQSYIAHRLEELGYTVEMKPFNLSENLEVKFSPVNPQHGWITTIGKIYSTIDAGQTWQLQYEGDEGTIIKSIFPVDDQVIYAVGDFGTILKSVNGGQTWAQQTSPTDNFLFKTYFVNKSTGWIAGDNGIILKTIDGGKSWFIQDTPVQSRLYDISFLDENTGWAVGRDGIILHTINGGRTWNAQTSGTTDKLRAAFFIDQKVGFVVGSNGTLLKTADAGDIWIKHSLNKDADLYDIDFYDGVNGGIVGSMGTYFITEDGGSTWSENKLKSSENIRALDFVDAGNFWATSVSNLSRFQEAGGMWQNYSIEGIQIVLNNLEATKTGTLYPDQYYIICAHYDDTSQNPYVRAPGADDNGSGTATVIEAARIFKDYNFDYSIRFVLFAGEEQGLVGSHAYAQSAYLNGEQIQGVLNMDMIGYDGNNDGLFEIHAGTLAGSQSIGTFVQGNVSAWGLNLVPEYKTSGSSTSSDHSSFWTYGYSAIMIIEDFQDFTPYYHTTNDLLNTLRPSYFLDNARVTIGSMALLAGVDTTTTTGIANSSIPDKYILRDPYPNPFNPTIKIEYSLPGQQRVLIEVFDVLGRSIRKLVDENQNAGEHKIIWDGKNDSGTTIASGIYLIRWSTPDQMQLKKVVFMR
jgi:photosystem II stability/assembly factor-like uncharacterized protein